MWWAECDSRALIQIGNQYDSSLYPTYQDGAMNGVSDKKDAFWERMTSKYYA